MNIFNIFKKIDKNNIFEEIDKNNIDGVIKILNKDPNQINAIKTYYTPLLYACLNSREDIAIYLIEKGANINYKNTKQESVKYLAKQNNLHKVLKIIDPNYKPQPIKLQHNNTNDGLNDGYNRSFNNVFFDNGNIDTMPNMYKDLFTLKEYKKFMKLITFWVRGVTDRKPILREYLERLPGITRTVYRGNKHSKEIRPTLYFSTSTNINQTMQFSSNSCCRFIIHLVNVPAYYVDTNKNESTEYENEYLVLGGGTFWQNKEQTERGFLEREPGIFECWYTPPNLNKVITPLPKAIGTRNEDRVTETNRGLSYSVREIHPLALGIQNSNTPAMQLQNLLDVDMPQSGYKCYSAKDGMGRFCILWDANELGNYKKEKLYLGVYMILTEDNNLLITTCEPANTILLASNKFLREQRVNHIIVMGDIPENTIVVANKTMTQNYSGLEKIFSTYYTEIIADYRADTFHGSKMMNIALVSKEAPPTTMPPTIMPPPPPPPTTMTVSCVVNKNQVINGNLMPNTQMGSNLGGIFIAENECKYYLKEVQNIEHAEQEVLASKLYKAAGIKCADVELAIYKNKPVILSSWIESQKIKKEYIKTLQNGFAIDAWLANWDVIGESFDNFIIDSNGEAIRIDTGGALEYRAMGKKKEFSADKVDEFFTLRNREKNKNAAIVFNSISNEKLLFNLNTLESIEDETIIQIVAAHISFPEVRERLTNSLIQRRKILITIIKQTLNQTEASPVNPIKGGTKKRIKKHTKNITNKHANKTKK